MAGAAGVEGAAAAGAEAWAVGTGVAAGDGGGRGGMGKNILQWDQRYSIGSTQLLTSDRQSMLHVPASLSGGLERFP